MLRRPDTFFILLGALLMGACLEDVTVGLDSQRLAIGDDAAVVRDAATHTEGGPPSDDGGVITGSDGGETPDGGTADAGSCAPDDCPVEIQIVNPNMPCPGDAPRVCARNENARCAMLCPAQAPDLRCGGVHLVPGTELTCGDETFCLHEVGSCDATEMGMCAAIPTSCTKEEEPVCGCDGNTYGNACQAHQASVSVRSLGACP